MIGPWKSAVAAFALVVGLAPAAAAAAAPGGGSSNANACAQVSDGASCVAVRLVDPTVNWHPGRALHRGSADSHGPSGVPAPPGSGYYPGDLQSAYGLAAAAASFGPGPAAPTVDIVDAYDDPNALSDLTSYRASLSSAVDPNTGLADSAIPPICGGTVTTGCVSFKKVNETGGSTMPRGDSGWSQEISLDLDMISAVCPDCNIGLVEASSNSFADLEQAVSYAKSQHPAAVTNSYAGGEFSLESVYNSVYSSSTSGAGTAVTAASGDNGYGTEFPAAAPGLTAVGGTSLTFSGSGSSLVWNPQTVWSGAGAGCSSYESMPSWQSDANVYSKSSVCSGRQMADISAVADPYTGVAVYDTYSESGWLVFGGTSVSTQIIGAVYALAASSGTMLAGPNSLYVDSGTATGPTPGLAPVTSGSDGNCSSTYLCNAADSLSSGYNGPSGLGTPSGLAAFLSGPVAPGFTLSTTGSQSVTQGSNASYTISVADQGSFSGSVQLAVTAGLPANATASFSPDPTSSTSTLTVKTTASTPASSYSLTVTGTSGNITRTVAVALTVQGPQTTRTMTVAVAAGRANRTGHGYQVPLTVSAHDATSGTAISGAGVSLQVFSGSSCTGSPVASASSTTGSSGQAGFTFSSRSVAGYCALATVTDSGYSTGSGQTAFST